MKKISITILLFISLIATAQPNKGIDSATMRDGKTLLNWSKGVPTAKGLVVFPPFTGNGLVPDANRNWILGLNDSISGNSVGNFITANDAIIVNSSNNILHAENVIIRNSSGVTATGADHIIGDTSQNPPGDGANYSSVEGDANKDCGYGSKTSGVGNKNFVTYGVCDGANNTLGREGYCNLFRNSSISGHHNTLEGNDSHIYGSWIRVFGNNITVIGDAVPGVPQTFTISGVYIINQQGQTTRFNNFQEYQQAQPLMLFDIMGRPLNQYIIAKPINKKL